MKTLSGGQTVLIGQAEMKILTGQISCFIDPPREIRGETFIYGLVFNLQKHIWSERLYDIFRVMRVLVVETDSAHHLSDIT